MCFIPGAFYVLHVYLTGLWKVVYIYVLLLQTVLLSRFVCSDGPVEGRLFVDIDGLQPQSTLVLELFGYVRDVYVTGLWKDVYVYIHAYVWEYVFEL